VAFQRLFLCIHRFDRLFDDFFVDFISMLGIPTKQVETKFSQAYHCRCVTNKPSSFKDLIISRAIKTRIVINLVKMAKCILMIILFAAIMEIIISFFFHRFMFVSLH
jgi:hypothetical protein